MTALHQLFQVDKQPPTALLFQLGSGAFNYNYFVQTLQKRLYSIRDPCADHYLGHSFCRGAAQHAADNGILDVDIQQLGRWSSDAFKLYFNTSLTHCFSLNKRFFTGKAPLLFTYYKDPLLLGPKLLTT